MCRDRVSNLGPLALESDELPTALQTRQLLVYMTRLHMKNKNSSINVSCVTNGQTD